MALALAILLLLGIVEQQALWVLLAVVPLLAVLLAEVWRRWCLTNVTYRRQFSSRHVPFGGTLDLAVEITNRKLLPLVWLEAEDELPNALAPTRGRVTPSYRKGRCLLTNLLALRPYEQVRRHYRLLCTTRGEHAFGPLVVRSGDVFGLAEREETDEATERIVVYPRVLPVLMPLVATRRLLGDEAVRTSLFHDPSRLAGIREYQPGDSVRQVHWPATARLQRLQIKRFDPSGARRLLLCVDLDTSDDGHWLSGYDAEQQEQTIMVAASLAEWAAERGIAVGLRVNGRPYGAAIDARLPAGAGREQRTRLLELLGRLMPYTTRPIEQVLELERQRRSSGQTVMLVATALHAAKARALAALCGAGHDVVAVVTGSSEPTIGLGYPVWRLADPTVPWREREVVRLG